MRTVMRRLPWPFDQGNKIMISKNLLEQLIEVETTRQVVSDAVRDPISGNPTWWTGPYTLFQIIQGKIAENKNFLSFKSQPVLLKICLICRISWVKHVLFCAPEVNYHALFSSPPRKRPDSCFCPHTRATQAATLEIADAFSW